MMICSCTWYAKIEGQFLVEIVQIYTYHEYILIFTDIRQSMLEYI